MATLFLDEQLLTEHVPFQKVETTNLVSIPDPPRHRTWHWLATIAVCLIAGIFVGRELTSNDGGNAVAVASGPTEDPAAMADLSPTVSSNELEHRSLPAIFQAKNTITEAVYYTDFSLPQFLLEALVKAGHRVELDQDFLSDTESPDSFAAVPINVVRIHKYGNLLASVDLPSSPAEPNQE